MAEPNPSDNSKAAEKGSSSNFGGNASTSVDGDVVGGNKTIGRDQIKADIVATGNGVTLNFYGPTGPTRTQLEEPAKSAPPIQEVTSLQPTPPSSEGRKRNIPWQPLVLIAIVVLVVIVVGVLPFPLWLQNPTAVVSQKPPADTNLANTALPTATRCETPPSLPTPEIDDQLRISYPTGGNCFLSPARLPLSITWSGIAPDKYYLWVLDNPASEKDVYHLHWADTTLAIEGDPLKEAGTRQKDIPFTDHQQHNLFVILVDKEAHKILASRKSQIRFDELPASIIGKANISVLPQ